MSALGRTTLVTAGWYGKIAGLGDFASRRLDPAMTGRLDGWLQEAVAGSRRRSGAAWTEIYLTSPVWRFMLYPGACGAGAWTGLLMPSVDKVGRYFPLVIAAGLPPRPLRTQSYAVLEDWLDRVEPVALATLDTSAAVEAFDGALSAVPLELPEEPPPLGGAARMLFGAGGDPEPAVHAMPGGASIASTFARVAVELAGESMHGDSLWWAPTTHGEGLLALRCPGLPGPDQFDAMLRGS